MSDGSGNMLSVQRLSLTEKIGYGLGDTASNIVFQVVINLMVFYYTDVYGLSAAAVGTLMLVVRVFDAVTDPLMGGIADRTRTRWGRYRPYLVWIALPYGALAVLAFTTPDLSDSGKLIYAYVTYALLMTAYTAINIPYSALGGVITGDTRERASVQSWRFALAMIGGAIVMASIMPLVEFFGGDDQQRGFMFAMMVLGAAAIVCFLACFALTTERVEPPEKAVSKNILGDVVATGRNGPWVIIALATLVLLISVAMKGGATPYFVTYYLGSEELIGTFLSLGMLAGVAGALTANWMIRHFCKVTVMRWAAVGIFVLHVALFFVPSNAVYVALGLSILATFVHMILIPYMFSAIADTVDYGIEKNGKGAMAMSFAGHLFALKIGIAIGGSLVGWILSYVNYVPNVEQTELSLLGIRVLYALASAAAGIVLLVLLRFYTLDREWAAGRTQRISEATA